MTRFNSIRKFVSFPDSIGRENVSVILFAALLIVCSIAVGCSSDKPKPANSTSQIPVTQTPTPPVASSMPAAVSEPRKPAPKKVVKKRPATVTYTDKTYGVSFDYPRRYAIETGDAANELIVSSPVPLNFVQPGGIALAAVELPETSYTNTDFFSAFFDVSVHKNLTAEQCGEFAMPQPKSELKPESKTGSKTEVSSELKSDSKPELKVDSSKPSADPSAQPASTSTASAAAESPQPVSTASSAAEPQGSKLMIGDMELRGTEAVSGEGTRQSDAKYFHVFQNGACYEFALNVTTVARQDAVMKHVDRDKVFARLEQILSTVKINPVAAEPKPPAETAATVPAAPAVPETPVQ